MKFKGMEFMKGLARGHAEDTLKPHEGSKEAYARVVEWFGDAPFAERDADEQAEMFYELHSLLAEKRDLVRSRVPMEQAEEQQEGARFAMRKMAGGRRVRVPVPSGAEREQHRGNALEASAARLAEVRSELGALGMIAGLQEAYEQKLVRLYVFAKMAREAEELRTRQAEIAADVEAIRREALSGAVGAVVGAAQEQIAALDGEHTAITERLATLQEYTQGHEVERFLRIHEYSAAAQRDGVIEIPSIAATVEEGLDHLRHGQPFLLAGHLGSGKTMMAMHMAKLFMIENGVGYDPATETDLDAVYERIKPEFFSGSDEASVYDLVGKMALVARDAGNPQVIAERAEALQRVLSDKGYAIPKERLAEVLLGKSDVTETIFRYGPLGRALRDGIPIVVDEINLVPPEVLGRLNQELLRGVGSKARLQENGEEEIERKPGFGVLATCNLGAQYAGTKEVNAAFASRWVAKEVQYPSVEETYDLALAALVRKDRVRLPPSFPPEAFEQLADLAITTHEIQGAFSGRTDAQRFMAMAHGVAPERAQLEQTVISPRDLMRKILGVWKERDFSEPLDRIIARNILAAAVFSSDDQKFMSELFIRRGFFQGWTAEQFSNAGISSVAQQEIDALQAAMRTDEYKTANAEIEALRQHVHAPASLIRDELLLGTRKPRTGNEDTAAAA